MVRAFLGMLPLLVYTPPLTTKLRLNLGTELNWETKIPAPWDRDGKRRTQLVNLGLSPMSHSHIYMHLTGYKSLRLCPTQQIGCYHLFHLLCSKRASQT